jgi:hypothetical protein
MARAHTRMRTQVPNLFFSLSFLQVGSGLLVTYPIQTDNATISQPLSISPLLALASVTPYSLTWTISGNTDANITYVSLVNTRNVTVAANSSSVYAAVADFGNATTGQYTLCALIILFLS